MSQQNLTEQQISEAESASIREAALTLLQRSKNPHWHEVAGVSMWPFLMHGDSVFVQPLQAPLRIGDVALLRFGERLLIHRISKINADGSLVAWGDFNLRPDPTAKPEQVLGVAISIKRNQQEFTIGRTRRAWGHSVIYLRPLLRPAIVIVRKLLRIKQICYNKFR